MIKFTVLLLPWLGLMAGSWAAEADPAQTGYLVNVYNRFIERYADENPAWKADITLGADLKIQPAASYKQHYNDLFGYYTYRPKTWDELDDYEKFALQNDPRLPHFIREHAVQLRTVALRSRAKDGQGSELITEHPRETSTDTAMSFGDVVAPGTAMSAVGGSSDSTGGVTAVVSNPDLAQLLAQTETLLQETRQFAVDVQKRGILTRQGDNEFSYRFDPDELITPKPLRLIEAQ